MTDYTEHLGQEVRGSNGNLRFIGRLVGVTHESVTVHFGATNLTLPIAAVSLELVDAQPAQLTERAVAKAATEPAAETKKTPARPRRTTAKEATK